MDPTVVVAGAGPLPPATAAAAAERLIRLYRAIATRGMIDLGIAVPRLEVQAVGFRDHDGRAVGVMVTPWFMNLVVAPLAGGPPPPDIRPGDRWRISLPAGHVAVIAGTLEGFGRLDTLSLFSPMHAFEDPVATRIAAQAAIDAAFTPVGTAAPSRRALLRGGRPGR